MGFDKFSWLKALVADPALSDKEVRLAALICISKVRRDGTGWRVYLDELAAEIPGGMDSHRMRTAFQKLVRRGFLIEQERSMGGRGRRAYRWFNLSKPGAAQHQVSEKPGAETYETRCNSVPNPVQKRTGFSDISAGKTPQKNAKGTLEGTLEGTGSPKSIPEEPPSKACTEHPNWTDWPCLTCKRDKNAYQTWLTDSRRLLSELDYQRDRATGTEAAAISHERRNRIAVFQRLGENWK
jgi:hypothetical protein